jgi:hypothetical protein
MAAGTETFLLAWPHRSRACHMGPRSGDLSLLDSVIGAPRYFSQARILNIESNVVATSQGEHWAEVASPYSQAHEEFRSFLKAAATRYDFQ